MVRFHDTRTRKMVEFEPIDPPRVRMYVCGPTVYDSPHVGHARSAVAFDVIRRYLEYRGYDVIFTRNYTDIDDKMIARANEQGISITELARKYIGEYEEAMDALNVKPPVYAPRATHLIGDMIDFVQVLIDKGNAYEVNGNVYFHVPSFPAYGELGRRPAEEMEDLLRRDSQEFADEKRDPRDFALWKAQKPGEPAWDSPWGKGRPGWHIECSVMSTKLMGEEIDFHGGGRDLVFPHHENENAQSVAYSGKTFVRCWLHNGFVTVDKEKMSKSLGNFFTVSDVLKEYPAPVLRMFLVSAHYRNPIDYSRDLLDQAAKNWSRVRDAWMRLVATIGKDLDAVLAIPLDRNILPKGVSDALEAFEKAMDDDCNTPRALASVFSLVKLLNGELDGGKDEFVINNGFKVLSAMLEVLGFDRRYIERHATAGSGVTGAALAGDAAGGGPLARLVDALVAERAREREKKNWKRADEIRDLLKSAGIALDDGPDGTRWRLEG